MPGARYIAVEANMKVIAHFSRAKAFAYVIGWLIACALLYGLTLYHPVGVSLNGYLNSKGLFRYEFAVIAWVLGTLLIARQLTILNQLILRKSVAVWASRGNIYYLNVYWDIFYRTVRCSDVEDFDVATNGSFGSGGIVIRLRAGQEKVVTTWLLSEPTDMILSRLRASCQDS